MKKQVIKKYLKRIFIYTAIYLAVVLLMDFVFNGMVVDYLVEVLPYSLFRLIWNNKTTTSMLVYIVGLVVISVVEIFRLTKLLTTASEAISQDTPEEDNVPEELKEFSQKLREFKQMVRANEEARKAAEQQKNDLIVYLAHDLKTPLTSVIGYLSLLEESPELTPQQRAKYTGIALKKAYRLENLINEFFDITRLNLQGTSLQKVPVNLTVLLLQVISEFYPMLESKNMTVEQAIQPELKLTGDPDKLARLFENLLRNAVNYGYPASAITCSAQATAGFAQIRFRNTGDTIPPEKLGRIFEKFYRLDDARQSATGGTGLGLAISRQIVELHGGTITASSADSITEFTVRLPL